MSWRVVNSLDVIEFAIGAKNFTILYDGVPISERMGLKEGCLSTMFLCAKTNYKDHKYQVLRLQP